VLKMLNNLGTKDGYTLYYDTKTGRHYITLPANPRKLIYFRK